MKKAISIIDSLRLGWYDSPMTYYKKKLEFETQSYSRSAMDEIKMYLMEHEDKNPVFLVEQFRSQMDTFACESRSGAANFMFSIYYDVATDVLDVLLGMG